MSWKLLVHKQIAKLGFEIYKRSGREEYTVRPPHLYSTYSPWFDTWFTPIYSAVSGHTVVTADRCYILYQLGLQSLHVDGDYAEAGVYRGGTAKLLKGIVEKGANGRRLHLFDTFAGMPGAADDDPSHHRAGDFGDTSLEAVAKLLDHSPVVDFHAGMIPETFAGLDDRRFAFVHVDVDLYQSSLDSCEYFYPRLAHGGVMVFDDYGFLGYEKAMRAAVDTFFSDKPESMLVLPTGQCVVVKL